MEISVVPDIGAERPGFLICVKEGGVERTLRLRFSEVEYLELTHEVVSIEECVAQIYGFLLERNSLADLPEELALADISFWYHDLEVRLKEVFELSQSKRSD